MLAAVTLGVGLLGVYRPDLKPVFDAALAVLAPGFAP